MVGPGHKTRGGITAVISAYQNSNLWGDFIIKWIDTYNDKNILTKIAHFFSGSVSFIYNLPKANIIHIHLSEPVSSLRKLFFFLIAKLFFKPVIVHLHSFDIKTSVGSKFLPLYRFLFSKADKVIVLSPFWEKEVKAYIPNCQIEVIFNPCPIILKSDCRKEKIILYAGTLNERKGFSLLIESFSQIGKKYPDWKLVFAGNGEIERATKLADQFNILNQIEFMGWVSGEKKNEIFSKSIIFCLPSYAEGFPMAILDAFSYRLPVISTKCGGIDMVLKHKEHVLFFEMGNALELTKLLDELISNEELRNTIGNNGFQFSKHNFGIDVIVSKLITLYKSI